MRVLIKDSFKTNLGEIELTLTSESEFQYVISDNLKAENENYRIKIIFLDLNKKIIGKQVEISRGWRIFIEKKSNHTENLKIFCKLLNNNPEMNWDYASGENLDSVVIENDTEILHIGTEDGDAMKFRAENDDWFPVRLKNEISLEKPITNYIDFGFESRIPDLAINEQFYLHFLISTAKSDKSDKENISTWIEVDRSKKELDEIENIRS